MDVDSVHWPLIVEYWERVQEERLPVPLCDECNETFFPPRVVCPYCLSDNLRLQDSEGTGRLYSYSVVYIDYHPEWGERTPYINALIDLTDGPIIFANLVECRIDELEVGLSVEVIFDRPVGDQLLPLFRPKNVKS